MLLTFGAGELAPLLNLPEALLRETGLFLIAYTALVGWLGTRQAMPKALVLIVIAGNAAWTIASIALLFSSAVTPNLLGEVFVATQAIATGVLAELQYIGLAQGAAARWRLERHAGRLDKGCAAKAKQSIASKAQGSKAMDCFVSFARSQRRGTDFVQLKASARIIPAKRQNKPDDQHRHQAAAGIRIG